MAHSRIHYHYQSVSQDYHIICAPWIISFPHFPSITFQAINPWYEKAFCFAPQRGRSSGAKGSRGEQVLRSIHVIVFSSMHQVNRSAVWPVKSFRSKGQVQCFGLIYHKTWAHLFIRHCTAYSPYITYIFILSPSLFHADKCVDI